MLMKALDLLRTLGWGIVDFIYSLIDSLFDILKEINALDIVNSVSNESMFTKFYTGLMAIAVTVLGLFAIWSFVKKIMDPDEGLSTGQIVKEIIKCGMLVIMSTFLFVQSSTFSIKLSGYTANIFTTDNGSIGDNMLVQYVSYKEAYYISFCSKILNNISKKQSTSHETLVDTINRLYDYGNKKPRRKICGQVFLQPLFFRRGNGEQRPAPPQ